MQGFTFTLKNQEMCLSCGLFLLSLGSSLLVGEFNKDDKRQRKESTQEDRQYSRNEREGRVERKEGHPQSFGYPGRSVMGFHKSNNVFFFPRKKMGL